MSMGHRRGPLSSKLNPRQPWPIITAARRRATARQPEILCRSAARLFSRTGRSRDRIVAVADNYLLVNVRRAIVWWNYRNEADKVRNAHELRELCLGRILPGGTTDSPA